MMKMRKLLLMALGSALGLGGCSFKLEIALFNNASRAVTVRADGRGLALERGRFVQFYYPGEGQRWIFRLSTAECEYVYQVPRSLEHYPWSPGSNGPLKAQVEPDFTIYLLPPAANEVGTVSGYSSLQQDGFPLHPASTSCH